MKSVIQLTSGANDTMFYSGEHVDGNGSFVYKLEDAMVFPDKYKAQDIINAQTLKGYFCSPCWKTAVVLSVKLELVRNDSPPNCPACGHNRDMIKSNDGKWYCHGTHRI